MTYSIDGNIIIINTDSISRRDMTDIISESHNIVSEIMRKRGDYILNDGVYGELIGINGTQNQPFITIYNKKRDLKDLLEINDHFCHIPKKSLQRLYKRKSKLLINISSGSHVKIEDIKESKKIYEVSKTIKRILLKKNNILTFSNLELLFNDEQKGYSSTQFIREINAKK